MTNTRIGLTEIEIHGPTLHDLTIAYHQYVAQEFAKALIEKEPNYQKSLIMSFLWYKQSADHNNGEKMPFTVQQACQAVGVKYEV